MSLPQGAHFRRKPPRCFVVAFRRCVSAPVGGHEQSPWRGIRDPVQPNARFAQLLGAGRFFGEKTEKKRRFPAEIST